MPEAHQHGTKWFFLLQKNDTHGKIINGSFRLRLDGQSYHTTFKDPSFIQICCLLLYFSHVQSFLPRIPRTHAKVMNLMGVILQNVGLTMHEHLHYIFSICKLTHDSECFVPSSGKLES